jgi:hypothetical protein
MTSLFRKRFDKLGFQQAEVTELFKKDRFHVAFPKQEKPRILSSHLAASEYPEAENCPCFKSKMIRKHLK